MPSKSRNARRRAARQRDQQAIDRLGGKGDYFSEKVMPFLKKTFPPGTFSNAGARAGGYAGGLGGSALGPGGMAVGSNLGRRLGSSLGQGLSRLVGFGDYQVESNSLYRTGGVIPPGEAIPSFGVLGASTRVRHREYLRDIVVPATPTAFTLNKFVVNPGDRYTFPWLADIATQYQQYKFDGLVFEFKTLSSDITSGGALGAVILASNYDVVQPSFADKIQMENSQYAVSTKPSCSIIHTMECAPSQVANNLYYVRNTGSTTVAGQDNRFYDLANFQLATQGLPGSAGQVLGELWVSYDVQLFKPIINEDTEGNYITGVAPSDTAIYGASPTVSGSSLTASGSSLTFAVPGEYLVSIIMTGTTFVAPTYGGSRYASAQIASIFGLTNAACLVKVKITEPNQTFIMDYSASGSVATSQTCVSLFSYSLV